MKKLNILLLSALALGITTTSCTKKDDAATSPIVGKWTFGTYTITNSTGTSDPKDYNDATCPDKNYWNLTAAKTVTEHTTGDDSSNPCGTNDYTGTYTFNNNILHFDEPSYNFDWTVVSVASTKLVVSKVANGQTYTYTLTK